MTRKSLVEDALGGIKRIIVEGGLSSGHKIPTENELVKILGISRGPIREAVKILSAIGMIEIRRGNGTYIRELSASSGFIIPIIFRLHFGRQNPVDLVELRIMFEKGIMNLAIQKRLQKDIENLRDSINRLEQLVGNMDSDPKRIINEDFTFHSFLFAATQNNLIVELGKSIMELFIPALEKATKHGCSLNSLDHHRLLLRAVEERNFDLAEEAIMISIQLWKTFLF